MRLPEERKELIVQDCLENLAFAHRCGQLAGRQAGA